MGMHVPQIYLNPRFFEIDLTILALSQSRVAFSLSQLFGEVAIELLHYIRFLID